MSQGVSTTVALSTEYWRKYLKIYKTRTNSLRSLTKPLSGRSDAIFKSSKYVAADDPLLLEIIETTIRNCDHKFYGGAKYRILAQLPKIVMDRDMLIDELEKAFEREKNCYF